MKKNVSTQPENVVDKPIYDLEELLGEVYDMIEERRAIEGPYQEDLHVLRLYRIGKSKN